MSKAAAKRAPAPRSAPAAASSAASRKRKAAPVAAVSDDDDDDDLDLDAMLAGGSDDDDDGADGMSDDDIELDPAEVAAMTQLIAQQRKAKQSKTKQQTDDDDEEEEDEDEDEDGGDSSSDDGEEAGDEGTGRIARPAKKQKMSFLNNTGALLDKLGDLRLPSEWHWIETLQLATHKSFVEATGGEEANAAQDDLKREAAFYELSLSAASDGLHRLRSLNIPFRIPTDYYAERVKPDAHMNRIKDKLIEEQRKMAAVSERKAEKEAKKYAKQVQATKLQEKAAEKKANLAAAGSLRAQVPKGEQELGVERSLLPGVAEHIAANRAEEAKRRERRNAKREAKDKKYGHGGKKRGQKRNTAESAHGGKDYSVASMKKAFDGFSQHKPGSFQARRAASNKAPTNRNGSSFNARKGAGGGGRGGKPNRPGKNARAQSRK